MAHLDRSWLEADLLAQLEGLCQGRFTSLDLVSAQLAGIGATQARLNCFLHIDAEGALAAAKASDARRAAGQALPLDGLSLAVKDNLDVAGMPTTAGLASRRDTAPAVRDATTVAHLRTAGMVVLGKLNMQEGALGADNDNPHYGACHNPHRPGYTPGGSSGGSAAAVAAGLCSLALGTDSMGSVRIPASYCGVVGLKPSRGLLDTAGSVVVSRRLDHVGPLARSVRDLQHVLPLLAGTPTPGEAGQPAADKPLRLGIVDFGATIAIEPDVQAAFERALAHTFRLGHARVDLPPPTIEPGRARRAGLLLCEAEMLVELANDWQQHRADFSPQLAGMLAWAEGKHAVDLIRADRMLDAAEAQLRDWLAHCDVLLTPATPQRAFAFGSPVPANQADCTAFANMAGCPALSIPLPVAAGELPIGLQLIGPEGSEAHLLALAERLHASWGWHYRLPGGD